LPGSSIGDASLRNRCTLLLLLLLAIPAFGSGQQEEAAKYASVVSAAQEAMSRSDFKAAVEDFKQAVKMHPETAELWANLGLMEHESGDYAEAIRSFQQAIRLKSSLYVPNLFLGIDYMHTGNSGAAIQYLAKAERMNTTDPEAPLELGRAYSSAGDFPAAAREFTRATQLDPKQSNAWFGRGMAYLDHVEEQSRKLSTEGRTSSYAQALYAEAMARQSRYIEATDSFKKAIAAQPQPPCLHAEFGQMYLKQQKMEDAESEFKAERQANAGCGIPQGTDSAGRYGQCAATSQENLPKRTESELLLLSACAYFSGDYVLASNASDLLSTRPSHSLGALYWSIKADEMLAFQSLDHFEQMAPNSAPSHILLGDMYRQRQRYDDAQAQYKQALEISPADHAALLGLAYAYYGNASIDATIATASSALAGSPSDPELNLLMGEALISRHDFAGAEPFLQKGLAAKPQMLPHVHALLGTVYAETGRTQDAIAQLEMGLAADRDGGTYYKLARMYRKTGDTRKADAAMQQVKLLEQQRRKGAVLALEDSGQPAEGDR
jgi:tetratricopeptide (TPR) repeat protein